MTTEEIYRILFDRKKQLIDLREGLNRDYGNLRVDSIKQKRVFNSNVALIILAVLGFSPFLDTNNLYLLVLSLILYIFDLFYILFSTRESLDKENIELKKQQDRYNIYIEDGLKVIKKYLDSGEYTDDNLKLFFAEINSSDAAREISQENQAISDTRRKPVDELIYETEFMLWLFCLGTSLLFLSFFKFENKLVLLLSGVFIAIFITTISFIDFSELFIKWFSKKVVIIKGFKSKFKQN